MGQQWHAREIQKYTNPDIPASLVSYRRTLSSLTQAVFTLLAMCSSSQCPIGACHEEGSSKRNQCRSQRSTQRRPPPWWQVLWASDTAPNPSAIPLQAIYHCLGITSRGRTGLLEWLASKLCYDHGRVSYSTHVRYLSLVLTFALHYQSFTRGIIRNAANHRCEPDNARRKPTSGMIIVGDIEGEIQVRCGRLPYNLWRCITSDDGFPGFSP
jgi:hypothetical protein